MNQEHVQDLASLLDRGAYSLFGSPVMVKPKCDVLLDSNIRKIIQAIRWLEKSHLSFEE